MGRLALHLVQPDDLLLPQQFGVGNPGGVEPVILSIKDATQRDGAGLMSVDFANAFNTISRRRIAQEVLNSAPHLYQFVRWSYNNPSDLFTVGEAGQLHTLQSASGIRQGDPLGPLLFSLAVKPLVKSLSEQYATNNQMWAYLDDLFIRCNSTEQYNNTITFLQSTRVSEDYGLSVKPEKCWLKSHHDIIHTGAPLLGSWLGGPDTSENAGTDLVVDAAHQLSDRITLLNSLHFPLQKCLLLLRLSFYPRLIHYLRTLHPCIVAHGAAMFDSCLENTISDWLSSPQVPLSGDAKTIMHLPLRLGGLGLFKQEDLSIFAFGSSFTLSQGVLRDRNLPIADSTLVLYREGAQACADALNLPLDSLLSDDHFKTPHLQRRCWEYHQEIQWRDLYQRLRPQPRARLLENSAPLSRAWTLVVPSYKLVQLSDAEVRYALKRTLLFDSFEPPPPSRTCPECGAVWWVLHHLNCPHTNRKRVTRHNALVQALKAALHRVRQTLTEQHLGGLTHDLTTTDPVSNKRLHIDVGITSLFGSNRPLPRWPTEDEIDTALENTAGNMEEPDFFWEDYRTVQVHPTVLRCRTLRSLATKASLGVAIRHMETDKTSKYTASFVPTDDPSNHEFQPFVLTAGGGMSRSARAMFSRFMYHLNDSIAVRTDFRRWFFGRFSVILIRGGASMSAQLGSFTLA